MERLGCPAGFVTALARDGTSAVWAGTEDKGVFRLSPKLDAWKAFTAKDGLADDNVYAVAAERAGQVTADVFQEIDALMMPLIKLPSETVAQETETIEVFTRYLKLLLAKEQTDVRFVWFHIKARLKGLKAKGEVTRYNEILRKIQALPLYAREKEELAELARE